MTPLQRHLPLAEMVALGWADEDGNPVDPAALKSLSQGAATGLWAAVAPELADRGGLYLQDVDVAPLVTTDPDMAIGGVRDYAVDTDQAVRLWEESARRIGWTTG
ncbi:hypothetical protein [Nocardioides convexus]|uniref:hypothetical protein n=1 Tax=Nocardioides convexus TaxID=2712224 RepID=UPI002418740A|nr:hypothetical protein [Nocardioides convexus]